MGNIRISAFIECSELVDADGLEVDDKCSESNRSDWDVIISIIDNCVFSEIIECAWVCIHAKVYSIIISTFNAELVYEDFSSKSQNSFYEII